MNERIEAYLAELKRREHSHNTIAAYRIDLSQFGEYLQQEAERWGGVSLPLAAIDREILGGFFLSLKERGLAPASVARKIAAVKSFFHYLRQAGEIASDPTEGIGAPEVKKSVPETLKDGEATALFSLVQRRDTPEGLRDGAMLQLVYATGMRVGELVQLDVTDVQLGEQPTVRVQGRGGRERVLPIDAQTAEAVRAYLADGRPTLARFQPEQPALVLNHRGQRLTRQGFWLLLKGLARQADLSSRITPHLLRHSFATRQVGDGVALEQLRQWMGHASIATTQLYAQATGAHHPDAPVEESNGAALNGAAHTVAGVAAVPPTVRPHRRERRPAAAAATR